MRPQNSPCEDLQGDLFKAELENIVDLSHLLAKLAGSVEWARLDEAFGEMFCEDNGRPATSTRLMASLH